MDTRPTEPVIARFANGESPAQFASRAKAIAAMEERWPSCEIDTDDTGRTLVWADGETAENDDGSKAVAEIRPA